MDLKEYTSLFLPAVELELHRIVDHAFSPEASFLHDMLAYHLGWSGPGAGPAAQGKRIRPLLLLLSSAAVGQDWHIALPAAAAVELVHNFSLIHDDIQDNSPTRRGRPTVWAQWGIPQAINAGDAMFSLAQLAILDLQLDTSPLIALKASHRLNQAWAGLTEGQYLDLSYESRHDLVVDDYWKMINGKTAGLLAAGASIGALVGAASPSVVDGFDAFGRSLGLAFQIQDDYLGIWGNSNLTGKSTDSDLVSGKKSFPVLYGLSLHGNFATRWSAGPISPVEVSEIAAILTHEGVEKVTRQTTDQLTQRALLNLQAVVPHPNEAFLALYDLVQQLLSRQY
jgi:geranylgeranyl diphosphate synthase type I